MRDLAVADAFVLNIFEGSMDFELFGAGYEYFGFALLEEHNSSFIDFADLLVGLHVDHHA